MLEISKYHRIKNIGSAAVSLVAMRSGKITFQLAPLVISGSNIQPDVHQQLVRKYGSKNHP